MTFLVPHRIIKFDENVCKIFKIVCKNNILGMHNNKIYVYNFVGSTRLFLNFFGQNPTQIKHY